MKQRRILSSLLAISMAMGMCGTMLPLTVCAAAVPASPLINRNGSVYSDSQGTAYAACNEIYYDAWYGTAPGYLAFDLSAVPKAQRGLVNLVWYATAWNSYDYTVKNENGQAAPAAYTISVNAAEGGAYPEDGWVDVVSIRENPYHSRQHVFDMTGYQWVRISIEEAQSGNTVSLNVDLHDCSAGVDSWIFYGDSITAGGMTTFSTGDGNFADLLQKRLPDYYPAQENGGIGGIFSTDGKNNMDRWLADFPGSYVSIAYGTNDCWGDQTGAERYYDNLVSMTEMILAAGKTPVVPKIPYSTEPGITANIEAYNAQIDRLYEAYPAVIAGPDFYSYLKAHPEYLGGDGVHLNTEGYNAMRILWAETMAEAIYEREDHPPTDPPVTEPMAGDVNEDGMLSMADVIALGKYLLGDTQQRYPNWRITADLDGSGILNGNDASLVIRQILLITPMPLAQS